MQRNPDVLLDYEIKRRPTLAVLVDRLPNVGDAEIDALAVLPWIKKAIRDRRENGRLMNQVAHVLAAAQEGVNIDPLGVVARYTGATMFVPVGRTRVGWSEIEIREGELIFLPDRGGAWIGTIFIETAEHLVNVYVSRTNLSVYKMMTADEARSRCPPDAPVIGDRASPLSAYGVRISRI